MQTLELRNPKGQKVSSLLIDSHCFREQREPLTFWQQDVSVVKNEENGAMSLLKASLELLQLATKGLTQDART